MNVSRTYNYESDLTVYPANRVASMSVVLKILSKMVSLAIFTLYCGQLFVALLYRAARQTLVALIYFYTFSYFFIDSEAMRARGIIFLVKSN